MPRPRKSDSEKAAAGTLQPCRQRQVNASEFELTLDPPVGLTKDAREAWKLAVMCAPKGALTALDFTVLERWARNYAFYRKLQKDLDHNGLVLLHGCRWHSTDDDKPGVQRVHQGATGVGRMRKRAGLYAVFARAGERREQGRKEE